MSSKAAKNSITIHKLALLWYLREHLESQLQYSTINIDTSNSYWMNPVGIWLTLADSALHFLVASVSLKLFSASGFYII